MPPAAKHHYFARTGFHAGFLSGKDERRSDHQVSLDDTACALEHPHDAMGARDIFALIDRYVAPADRNGFGSGYKRAGRAARTLRTLAATRPAMLRPASRPEGARNAKTNRAIPATEPSASGPSRP